VAVRPAAVTRGRRVRLSVAVSAAGAPVVAATVRVGHRRVRTDRRGHAVFTVVFSHAGRVAIAARKRGYRSRRAIVRVRG
jgi:hypothetical protein